MKMYWNPAARIIAAATYLICASSALSALATSTLKEGAIGEKISNPAAARQQLSEALLADKRDLIASLPIVNLPCGVVGQAVYLWPRERMLLGFITGDYASILDDAEYERCDRTIEDLKEAMPKQSILMARDSLHKNLCDYVVVHFEELKNRAAKQKLSDEELDFLYFMIEWLLPAWRPGVTAQEQVNTLGLAFLAKYRRSRFRADIIPKLRVYERAESWPMEFALGYGFGAYQGAIKGYLSGLSYLQSDFHFYKDHFFLAWFSKLGFGTSGVKQPFGSSWQSGDVFETFLAMDFDVGYRVRLGNMLLVKPFAGFGFSMASRGLYFTNSKDRSPSTGGDLGFNIGACFDFRFWDLANHSVPKGEDPSYVFLRVKLDYHYFLGPMAGEVGDGIFYTSFQVGMMFNSYRMKSFDP